MRASVALFLTFSSLFWTTPSQASEPVVCDTYRVNGGDEAFLMTLNTPLEFGGTVYDGNIYVSPKGTVTFGQGDYTFWDYPATPSISIASFDYHAFANGVMWGAENDLYVKYGSTATSICVDWKVMLWGQSSGEPIYIRMIAYVDPVNYTWTPTYQVSSNAPANARYGVRYTQNGEVFPLDVQTITEPPVEDPVIEPEPSPEPEQPAVIPPFVPEGASIHSEGSTFEIVAPAGQMISSISGYYGDPEDGTRGLDVSQTLYDIFVGKTSESIGVSNETFAADPAPGTVKILIVLVSYESIPVETTPIEPSPEPTPEPTQTEQPVLPEPTPTVSVEPSPEPTPSTSVAPSPEPSQEPEPSPSPLPTIEPSPTESATPVPTPSVEPTPEVTAPSPQPSPVPTETQTPEPGPTIIPQPTPSPTPSEPEFIIPSDAEELIEELLTVDPSIVSLDQLEEIKEMVYEVFDSVEPGSEEYQQALEALAVLAQVDDAKLPEELAAIPLIGDVAGAVLDTFNALGNVGADMSPKVREQSEDVIVAAVIVGQVAITATTAAASAAAVASRRI